MNYLLDTHAFIWAALETNKLSKNAQNIILNGSNDIFVSTVSFWEISLKTRINKFLFENINIMDFAQYAKDMDFAILDMKEYEAITFHKLPLKDNHKDPFDRMLIWQAITQNMTMISKDKLFKQYKENGLKIIW
ncbi:MAG: type II toxin-antitoxin system VapC family toxin [Prevotellaceae bacterium]|jgi:PIN domain nuclease of toxin-antitoxin system|nr:type II toxin-antitoxin system VapC family toxin [Prevotellaceae bacterium]